MYADYPCLPLVQERFLNAIVDKIPKTKEGHRLYPTFDVIVFSQIWGSTALGFGGFGGQAMTKAYTVIIKEESTGIYGVFFGDRLAYVIQNPNKNFFEDIQKHNMASVDEMSKYRKR